MSRRKHKIPGAHRTKGRFISGHPAPLEERTFQETEHEEAIDRITRLWRPEPRARPETADEMHRLARRPRGVAADSLPVQPSGVKRVRPEQQAPAEPVKTVEQRLGDWIYTVAWPSGEILDKRKEV